MQNRHSAARRSMLAALLALALLLAAVPAAAVAGVPTYEAGTQVTFSATMTSNPAGGMYIQISAKRNFDRYGRLKETVLGTFASMKKRGAHLYKWTTPPYTFDTWFMNRPGTYYWQTQWTDCAYDECRAHGKTRSFRVR